MDNLQANERQKIDEKYMTICLELARKAQEQGEVPIGALIARGDEILAIGHNKKEKENDPTAHAELLVIQEAAKKIANWRLTNCTLYVSLEPCPMCAGAIIQSRIKRLVYGCNDPKAGAVSSLYQITQDKRLNHQTEVTSGVFSSECSELLTSFFKSRR